MHEYQMDYHYQQNFLVWLNMKTWETSTKQRIWIQHHQGHYCHCETCRSDNEDLWVWRLVRNFTWKVSMIIMIMIIIIIMFISNKQKRMSHAAGLKIAGWKSALAADMMHDKNSSSSSSSSSLSLASSWSSWSSSLLYLAGGLRSLPLHSQVLIITLWYFMRTIIVLKISLLWDWWSLIVLKL